jgi:hypothetical protein
MEEVLTADERLQLSNLTEHVRKQLFGRSVADGANTPPDATGDSSEQGSIYESIHQSIHPSIHPSVCLSIYIQRRKMVKTLETLRALCCKSVTQRNDTR